MIQFSDMLSSQRRSSPAVHRQRRRSGIGFTLVEMLAVIGIIGVLGVAIGVALSGGNSSAASLGNAQRMVSSMFQAARTNAVMKGQDTAVIIYKQAGSGRSDSEKYLRFIGIVYKDTADGNKWKPLNRGTYLPKGIYFVPPSGASNTFTNAKSSSNSLEAQKFSFPIQTFNAAGEPNSPQDEWFMYTFDKNGNLSKGSTYLLFSPISAKAPPNSNGTIQLESEDEAVALEQMGGIAIRKSGGILMIDYLNETVYNGLQSDIGKMK